MEQGIYELPLNERLRTFMRIEFLFSRLKYFVSNLDGNWQTRTVIHTLLEIYSILSRTDVRREVLADLDRYIMQMQRFQSAPDADNDMVNNVLEDLDLIKNQEVIAFAGIGNPDNFFDLLETNKIRILKKISFPDHYNYSDTELENLTIIAKEKNAILLTTEKDYLRISENYKKNINYLKIKTEINNKDQFVEEIKKII